MPIANPYTVELRLKDKSGVVTLITSKVYAYNAADACTQAIMNHPDKDTLDTADVVRVGPPERFHAREVVREMVEQIDRAFKQAGATRVNSDLQNS
jgi:hypothetical protein